MIKTNTTGSKRSHQKNLACEQKLSRKQLQELKADNRTSQYNTPQWGSHRRFNHQG